MKSKFTKEEAKELIIKNELYKYLKLTEMLRVFWWDFFNDEKRNLFLTYLKDGKSVKFAYSDTLLYNKETNDITKTIKKYTDRGIDESKLILTYNSSVCIYSISKHAIVAPDNNVPNNDEKIVSLMIYKNLSKELIYNINNSNGIIVSYYHTSFDDYKYRFGFIPK